MFSDYRMAWPAFVHYGKGGDAPAIDNADIYVYIVSADRFGGRSKRPPDQKLPLLGPYLARVPRAKIANLDKRDYQYYKGGDGMDDKNWAKDINDSRPFIPIPFITPKIVYNYALKRYILGNEFYAGVNLYEAPRLWGPWTKILAHKEPGAYWGALAANKWTSADGKKMWYIATGCYRGTLYPYGFLFNPIYLSRGTVDSYAAADAKRSPDLRIENDPTSILCVTRFAKTGDSLGFTVRKISDKGWHIVKIQFGL